MMKRSLWFTLLLIGSLQFSNAAFAGEYVIASNLMPGETHSGGAAQLALINTQNHQNNNSVGQSFTSRADGTLTTINAMISAGDAAPLPVSPPLSVSIYTSTSGVPISLLGALSFPASQFPVLSNRTSMRTTLDFSSLQIPLSTGQEYLIAFSATFGITDNNIPVNAPFYVDDSSASLAGDNSLSLGRNLSSADDGTHWHVDFFELGLEVRAIPEPTTATLLLLGMLGGGWRRRR